MNDYHFTQTTEGFNCIFIRSDLDDAGLTPYEFRLYAHLSRRASSGVAFPSKRSMASTCRISVGEIKRCLRTLIKRGMITRQLRDQQSSLYTVINDPKKWKDGDLQDPRGGSTGSQGGDLQDPHKVIQAEGNPLEGSSEAGASGSLKASEKDSNKTEASKNGSVGNDTPPVPVVPPIVVLKVYPPPDDSLPPQLPPTPPAGVVTIPAKLKPVQPHVALVEAYGRAYLEVTGQKYHFTGRDWPAAKLLHQQGMSPGAIEHRAGQAMRWPQQFLQEQAMAFHSFAANYSRYIKVKDPESKATPARQRPVSSPEAMATARRFAEENDRLGGRSR